MNNYDFLVRFCELEIRSRLLSINLDHKIAVVHIWLKMKILSQGVMKLSRLEVNFVSVTLLP